MLSRTFTKDFDKTRKFYEKNKDMIATIFKDGTKLYNVEFDSSDLAKLFDTYSGIDYILLSNKKVLGVAARINFMPIHHNHITIRYKRTSGSKTEFQKRCESIINHTGEIYASVTMQIDALQDRILRAVAFESDKLYMTMYNNLKFYEDNFMKANKTDGNLYFEIDYNVLMNISKKEKFHVSIVDFTNKSNKDFIKKLMPDFN